MAGALETTPYDEARLRAALDSFTRNGTDLIAIGSQAMFRLSFVKKQAMPIYTSRMP